MWLGASTPLDGAHRRRLAGLAARAAEAGVPLLATNDVLQATRGDRPLADVLACIRLGTTIEAAGRRLEANGERHLKPAGEMAALFADHPHAIAATRDVLDRVGFDLGQLEYEYPHEPVPPGWTPIRWLRRLVGRAAAKRWPQGIPDKAHALLKEEFALIAGQNIAYYF